MISLAMPKSRTSDVTSCPRRGIVFVPPVRGSVTRVDWPKRVSGDETGERQLTDRARRGDPGALATIYGRFATDLFNVARRITRSDADAEDVLHDLFVGLPELLQRYTEDGRLGGWLRRVTIRLSLLSLRRAHRRSEAEFRGHEIATPPTPITTDATDLGRAIDALPQPLRTVFVLRQIEDLSHDEIAELLGISAGASRVRYLRAVRSLRSLLEP